ncbi:hypothetical protein [Rhodococcus sp. JS3073]|uniref:hypothetical protein n=1 Tax=Rhodococcus sp. JS3073 TaxID=3002901 RepID=UPI002286048C|nr:hypothetical protein [Rhodococcus sp. JS3073]WAM19562.1 hypothetical protein OYT95_38480 [Rhodococcus sp. JS3073]
MIVVIDVGSQGYSMSVDEVNNFGSLAVRPTAAVANSLEAAVSELGAGHLDGDHLWIEIDGLRDRGPKNVEWREKLTKMIDFADQHGWVDGGRRVRAHIE